MPIERCSVEGKPGFRWGKKGKCYTYKSGDADSRQKALVEASRQGRTIEANSKEGEKEND